MNGTKNALARAWLLLFHVLATTLLAVLFAVPSLDMARVDMLWVSYAQHGFDIDWLKVVLHFGLAACTWAMICIAYLWSNEKRKKTRKVALKTAKGSIMVEFLIILVPFLLLTSGLAQLATLNLTGILADLAVFQAARVAWVWQPDVDAPRNRVRQYHVRNASLTAASMALAPTAPSDYYIG